MTDEIAPLAPTSGPENDPEADRNPTIAGTPVDTHAASQALALPATILNPVTGELVPTDSLREVGLSIDVLRNARVQLDFVIAQFTEAVIHHSRVMGTRTLVDTEVKVTLSADTEIEWDIERLQRVLDDAGCPQERINKLIKTTVAYKVDQAVAKQLSAANPDYKAAIEQCQRRIPKRQYAKVEVL